MERGTVSMRVAFVLRSAEVQPLFRDLCGQVVVSKTDIMMRLSFLTPLTPLMGRLQLIFPSLGQLSWTFGPDP